MSTPDPRSRRAGLDREQVLRAALALLDDRGVAGCTLRALGHDLGVDPMTIYWHVNGKEALLEGVVGLVLSTVEMPSSGPWWRRAEAFVRANRQVMHEHPAVLDVVLGRPVQTPEAWSGTEKLLALLEPRLSADGAARWVRLLAAYTTGFLLTERRELRAAVPADDKTTRSRPRTAAARRQLALRSDADFEAGLQVLVRAMREEAERA